MAGLALSGTDIQTIIFLDAEGRIASWNDTATQITGYDSFEVAGQAVSILYPKEESDQRVAQRSLYAATTEGKVEEQATLLNKNGQRFPARIGFSVLRLEDDQIRGFLMVVRDIGERRRSEELFRLVVEAAPSGMIIVDRAGKIALINSQVEALFGYTREELLGQPVEVLVPENFRKDHPSHRERFYQDPSARLMGKGRELFGAKKNGARIPLEIGLNPLEIENQQYVLASVIDITQRKQEESLRLAKDQAQTESRLKSEFLANMSHEIRTPMNAIIGMSNLLQKTQLNQTQLQYTTTLREAGLALLATINDILDFSKIEAGKIELEIVDFDPIQIVESTCDLLASQARSRGISLLSFVHPDIPAVLRGDPDQLRQILLNLTSNAIKFSEQNEVIVKAVIEQTSASDDGSILLRLSVTDKGIGLTKQEQGRLFQPFVQADGSISRKYGGTGLGLSISKSLVELMNGKIGLESEKDQGSTFWFSVPLQQGTSAPPLLTKSDLADTRVLIVDDQENARVILSEYLQSWGMTVEVATTAKEALRKLRIGYVEETPYHLVIVDMLMPTTSGLDLGKAILLDPAISSAKLVLITAFDAPGVGLTAIDIGFKAYLTKPIRQSRLLECLNNVLFGIKISSGKETHSAHRSINQGLRKELILVAEDHPINQQVTTLYLKELGFAPDVVGNGKEALEILQSIDYSLILMDCQMPEMDGLSAARLIRKSEITTGKHIPIIAMTANAMKGDREKCIAAGMDDYISKPVDPAELSKILDRWLSPGISSLVPGEVTEQTQVPPIDVRALRERFRPPVWEQLKSMFLSSTPTTMSEIQAAMREQHAEQAAAKVHFLKGACSTIFASDMTKICKMLEVSILAGDNRTTHLFKQLEKAYDELVEFVGKEL
jgi:two-component system, sensor histidine kinase and response regulator